MLKIVHLSLHYESNGMEHADFLIPSMLAQRGMNFFALTIKIRFVPTHTIMSSTHHSSDIPQFVVIRDQVHNTYKHPIVHYVFEDEPFPEVTKENLILVDLDDNAQLSEIDSYSPHFQVIDCRLDHNSTVYDQFDGAHDGTGLMTIEGVSAPKA